MGFTAIIDKERVKEMLLQGLSNKDIAASQGVTETAIRVYKHRNGLGRELQVVKERVETAIAKREQVQSGEETNLSGHSAIVRKSLSEALVKASEGLDTLPAPKTVKARSEHGKMLKDLAEPAKLLYDWGNSTTVNVFNLSLLDQAQTVESSIDVESSPVEGEQVRERS